MHLNRPSYPMPAVLLHRIFGVLATAALAFGLAVAARGWRERLVWARPRSQHLGRVDRIYAELPPGNVFIRFDGLDADRDGEFIFTQFVRASYVRHPWQVYVAPPGIRLQDAAAILRHNSRPPANWLREHGVKSVVNFSGHGPQPTMSIETVGPDQ